MASAILLGGATRAGFPGDVVLQTLSIPLLAGALWPLLQTGGQSRVPARLLLLIGGAALILLGAQLIPLPAGWRFAGEVLPGVDPAASASSWSSLSVSPQAGWAAAASLIVPAAIFAAVIQFDVRQRMGLCWLLIGLGALALALGFVQMAQGRDSALRFYTITNPTEAVGFFANRNHFAAHLYVTLVLAAVWFAMMTGAQAKAGAMKNRAIFWFTAASVFLVAIVAGLAMARSRAGAICAMAALAGIVLMLLRQPQPARPHPAQGRWSPGRVSVAVVVFALAFAAQFGLGSILSRFEADPLGDLRIPFTRTTFETAWKLLPFGAGLGSFVPVYASVENMDDVFVGYANRAHNDFAELFLETGLPGAVLVLCFLFWFFRRTYEVWFRRPPSLDGAEVLLERASTLIVGLLLAHSLVDYPLRTAALSAVFAFACAVLAVPALTSNCEAAEAKIDPGVSRRGGTRSQVQEAWAAPGGIQWPEAWQKKNGGNDAQA